MSNMEILMLAIFYGAFIGNKIMSAQIPGVSTTQVLSGTSTIILASGEDTGEQDNPYNPSLALRSPGGKVTLEFDSSQDLVVVRQCDNVILWKQVLAGLGTKLAMLANGNFAIYGTSGDVVWTSNTANYAGADLRLQDNGYLCVQKDGICVWSNGKIIAAPCLSGDSYISSVLPDEDEIRNAKTVLQSGARFLFGNADIFSQNSSVTIRISKNEQGIELLTVFRNCDGEVLWSPTYTKTFNPNHEVKLIMQLDGNLVIYGTDEDARNELNAYWACGHYTHYGGAVLKIFDDGLLCVAKDNRCLWSNKMRFRNVDCSIRSFTSTSWTQDSVTQSIPASSSVLNLTSPGSGASLLSFKFPMYIMVFLCSLAFLFFTTR